MASKMAAGVYWDWEICVYWSILDKLCDVKHSLNWFDSQWVYIDQSKTIVIKIYPL